MQSIEVEPVPIQVDMSVHCLEFAAGLVVKLRLGKLTAALDAMLKHVVIMINRPKARFVNKETYAVDISYERIKSALPASKKRFLHLYRHCG